MALKPGSIIKTNEFLSVDDYIESPKRRFYAIMQGDGNFVVYRGTRDDPQGVLWHTNKYGDPGKFFALMQGDGNFVVYKGASPTDQQGLWWHTNKHGDPGEFFAVIQDDGNFVVYKGTSPADYQEVWWATGVIDHLKPGSIIRTNEFLSVDDYIESPKRKFFALMQGNGNFVVHRGTRDDPQGVLWHTNKYGDPGKFFALMQGDGNFVVRRGTRDDPQGELWHTNKHGDPGEFFAIIQDDGNFVVYKGTSPTDQQGLWWHTGVIDHSCWMGDLSEYIGSLPIKNIVIPGTHDSNTETTTWEGHATYGGTAAKSYQETLRAQEKGPWNQLRDGIRYLDLRYRWQDDLNTHVIYHGRAHTHTELTSTMRMIKEFVEKHPTEVVILNLSNWDNMNHERHRKAVECITGLLGENMVYWGRHDPDHDYDGSPNTTVNELRVAGKNVIVVYHADDNYHPQADETISEGMRFWREESIHSLWFNETNTAQLGEKLKQNLKERPPDRLFALQAQRTPNWWQCLTKAGSLKRWAQETNPKVIEWLQKWTTDGDPPISAQEARENLNIVIVDFYNIGGKGKSFVETLVEMNKHRATD